MPTQAAVDSDAGTTCVGTLDDKEAQRKAKNRAATAEWYANPTNKAKQKASAAKYRSENKERLKAKQKAYTAKYRSLHKEKLREQKKAYDAIYSAKNRDKLRASKAAYAAKLENKARKRETNAKLYAANKEKRKAQIADWKANNADKVKAIAAKHMATPHGLARARAAARARRAQKLSATIGDPKVIAEWEKGWRTAKSVTCYWCRVQVAGPLAHMDHVQPLTKGGSHAIDNLCISCQNCNHRKHAKDLAAWNKMLLEPVLL